MRTTELLKIVADRGLKIALKDGRPVILNAANNKAATDKLLAVLTIHREKIIAILSKEGKRT